MLERIGFIGTGAITEAVISGLATLPDKPLEIWVSPYNRKIATRLADQHSFVHVGQDNQDVADRCDLLCLAVRPQIAQEVIAALRLRENHHILSFIATWNSRKLAAQMPQVARIVRLAPLPTVAQGIGATIMYPSDEVAIALFSPLGSAIPVEHEGAFDCLFSSTALMGSFFAMLEAQAQWLQHKGVPYADARAYLASLFHGLALTANTTHTSFSELSVEFSTAGGLNEQMTADLGAQGVFVAQAHALDRILERIRKD